MFDNNQNFNNNMNNNFNNINSNMNFNNQMNQGYENNNINSQGTFQSPELLQQNVNQINPQVMNNNYSLNNFNSSNVDIPPDLPEIKNLNDATVASAPTMDVLNPMNIMPESLPNNNDPLVAYDNGNLNINNNYQNQLMNENVLSTQTNLNYSNNLNNANFNSNLMFNGQNFSTPTMTTPPINDIQNQFINNQNMMGINNNFDIQNGLNLNSNNINFPINDPNINNLYNNSQFSNIINPNLSESFLVTQNDNSNPNELETQGENQFLETNSLPNDEEKEDIKQSDETVTTEEDNNVNIADLELNSTYTEPDSLEIMDLESDIKEESEDDDEDTSGQGTQKKQVVQDVEDIKDLIKKLKDNGSDVEIEEFDFEEMYQLIIKLKK